MSSNVIHSMTIAFLAAVAVAASDYSWADTEKNYNVGVIYPQMREPYRSIFTSIRSGIEQRTATKALEVEKGQTLPDLSNWIAKNGIKILVSLGGQGLDTCSELPGNIRVLAGAILTPSEIKKGCVVHGGIALAPSPDKLFAHLKQLKPDVSDIVVVYNPELNGWLIQYARIAADIYKLKLNTVEVDSLAEAAQVYRELIDRGIGAKQAIWLPQDPYSADQKTILPMLLKESWNRNFVVFSSNPAHVNRGVLFALYPDYETMGRTLGSLAADFSKTENIKELPIQPLKDLLIAVNLRTADHLVLNLSNSMIDTFDLTFPASR